MIVMFNIIWQAYNRYSILRQAVAHADRTSLLPKWPSGRPEDALSYTTDLVIMYNELTEIQQINLLDIVNFYVLFDMWII